MSEWWTYRLSDFLMFSARTYHRLFELHNAEVWPAQIVTVGLGVAMGVAAWRTRAHAWLAPAVFGLLGLAWAWVGWAFHVQRFASINWAALWFGAAFVAQGLLLLVAACRAAIAASRRSDHDGLAARSTVRPGLALLLFALFLQPMIGVALGRPWGQIEVFAIAPDPTATATLGLLLMLEPLRPLRSWSWILWPLPLLWCVVAGATAWAMDAPDAWLMPALALLALVVLARARRGAGGTGETGTQHEATLIRPRIVDERTAQREPPVQG